MARPPLVAVSLSLALALGACGGVSGGTQDRGFPPANPRVAQGSRSVTLTLSGLRLRVPVPPGWSVVRDTRTRGGRAPSARSALATVISKSRPCYASASITGGSRRDIDARQIESLYRHRSGGYGWRLEHVGRALLVLLDQYDAAGSHLSRSTLGTVWLPLGPSSYLAVDIGAGIWPLNGDNCADPDVARRLSALHGGIVAMVASLRVTALPAATEQ